MLKLGKIHLSKRCPHFRDETPQDKLTGASRNGSRGWAPNLNRCMQTHTCKTQGVVGVGAGQGPKGTVGPRMRQS